MSKIFRKANLNESAFTLLEILVAAMIFGIIMLTIFSSFRSFLLSSQKIKTNIAVSETITSINSVLVRDFLSLRVSMPPEYTRQTLRETSLSSGSSSLNLDDYNDKFRFIGEQVTEGGKIFSKVKFASLAHIPFGNYIKKASGAAKIIYYVRQDEEGRFELCRSDTLNSFDGNEGTKCDPIICRNITKFEVKYVDIKGEEHLEWDSESENWGYSTPFLINIEMEFQVIDSIRTFSTSILMPVFRKWQND